MEPDDRDTGGGGASSRGTGVGECVRCGGAVGPGRPCPRCVLGQVLGVGDRSGSGTWVGEFELIEELGRGGMGRVWRARQRGLEREVAVKLLRGGVGADPESRERFRREALATGRLRHPGIVVPFSVGESQGEMFLAMEWVRGGSLADRLRSGPMGAREAASLVQQLAEAVQHAHDAGIVHRDLKPSNILLDSDRDGAPRLTDFGIASLEGAALTRLTMTLGQAGTPAYVAPERAGGGVESGPAVDVYGLGAVLYHALTGRPPFVGDSPVAVLKRVLEEEPIAPRALMPDLSRDLETICLRCLEKLPERRFETSGGLAEELGRYLDGQPIRSRPPGAVERGWKWIRRRPLAAALAAVTVAGLAATTFQWLRAEKGAEAVSRQLAISRNAEAAHMLSLDRAGDGLAMLARVVRSQPDDFVAGNRLASLLLHRPWALPRFVLRLPGRRILAMAGKGEEFCTVTGDGRVEGWRWKDGSATGWSWESGITTARWIGFSGDGRYVGVLGEEGAFALAGVGGASMPELSSAVGGPVVKAVFHPQRAELAIARGDNGLELWDCVSGHRLWKGVFSERVSALVWSADGTRLAVAGTSGAIRIHAGATGEPIGIAMAEASPVVGVDWHPDGALLAATTKEGAAVLWDVREGRRIKVVRQGNVNPARFNRRGTLLRFMSDDRTLVGTMVDGRNDAFRLAGVTLPPTGWAYVPGLDRAVFVENGRGIVVLDVVNGERAAEPLQLDGAPRLLAFCGTGLRLAVSAREDEVAVWRIRDERAVPSRIPAETQVMAARFTPRSEAFWAVKSDGSVVRTAFVRGLERRVFPTAVPAPTRVEPSQDGRLAAYATSNAVVQVNQLTTAGKVAGPWTNASEVVELRFSPDLEWLAVGTRSSGGVVHRIAGGEGSVSRLETKDLVAEMAFAPGSDRVLMAHGRRVSVRSIRAGGWEGELEHPSLVRGLAVHPDGGLAATAAEDGRIRLWDLADGRLRPLELAHSSAAVWVGFSPDGSILASAGTDKAIRLWDPVRGRHYGIAGTQATVRRGTFDPAGRRIAGVGDRTRSPLFDAHSGLALTESLMLRASSDHAEFSPDGEWLMKWANHRELYLYPVPLARGRVPVAVAELAEAVAGFRYDDDGVMVPVLLDERMRLEARLRGETPEVKALPEYWAGVMKRFLHPGPPLPGE